MTKNDDTPWVHLCEYVKLNILEYDDNMKFPPYLALKLKGLMQGKFIGNNNVSDEACYDEETLLIAFKLNKKKIVDYLHNNEKAIKDERHKINLVMKLIEPEINDVYLRIQQAKKTQERVENNTYEQQHNKSANYIHKTQEIKNSKLKNLF